MPPPDDQRRTFLGSVASAYRGMFAVFDFGKSAARRVYNLAIGALAIAFGGAAMWVGWYWWQPFFFNDRDPRWPWVAEFEAHGWVVVFGVGVIAALQGLAFVFEALRFSVAPKTGDVHGAARPAGEQEARLAARGASPKPSLNDRRFPD